MCLHVSFIYVDQYWNIKRHWKIKKFQMIVETISQLDRKVFFISNKLW